MRPKKNDDEQYGLDYSSRDNERWALLRSLNLGRSAQAAHVRFLLEIVAGVAGDGELRWTLGALAARMSLPARSVQRVVERAEKAQLLVVRRGRGDGGFRSTNKLAVDWSAIAERRYTAIDAKDDEGPISAEASADSRPGGAPGRRAGSAGRIARSAAADRGRLVPPDAPGAPAVAADLATEGTDQPSRPEPSPCHGGTTVTPPWRDRDATVAHRVPLVPSINTSTAAWNLLNDWAAAAEVLRGTGLADWRRPLDVARSRGLAPAEVIALVDFWRSKAGAFGLAALHWRLRNAAPGVPAADGWPEPRPARPPAASADAERVEHERTLYRIIRAARAEGVLDDDDEIRRRLADRLPAEFLRAAGWGCDPASADRGGARNAERDHDSGQAAAAPSADARSKT